MCLPILDNFLFLLSQVVSVAMATQVGVNSGEGGQTASPGTRKPNLAPKPHLMPKPFSLQKTPIRQIAAPKPTASKSVSQTTAPAKPVPAAAPKPTPKVPVKPDASGSSHLEVTASAPAVSPKPALVREPKPDKATRVPDVVSPSTPESTASKPEPASLSKAPPAVAPKKPAPAVPTKPDQANVVKSDSPKPGTLPSSLTKEDSLSRTAEPDLPKTTDGVLLRNRTKSTGASDRKQKEEALKESQGPDKDGSPTSQTTETSDGKSSTRWPIRKRLSAELTSMFEAAPLSVSPAAPLRPSKDNNQEQSDKKEPIAPPGGLKDRGPDTVQTTPVEPNQNQNQKPKPAVAPRREWKKSEEKENEKENEKDKDESSGSSIKRRISMLLDSSSTSQQREPTKRDEQQPTSPAAEISVDVKQRIKELKLDTGVSPNTTRG